MTSLSDLRPARVLRDAGTAGAARPARLTADLRTSPFATAAGADARLVDPMLERAVEERAAQAEEAGRVAGFAQGCAEGRAAAAVEAAAEQARRDEQWAAQVAAQQAELCRALEALQGAATELAQRSAPAAEEIERLALRTGVELAQALVARELAATDDVVLATVKRALSLAPSGTPVVLRVSPADAAVLTALEPGGRPVELVPDPSLTAGSCVVDAGTCRIDGRIEQALDRARAVLAP